MGKRAELPIHSFIKQRRDDIKRIIRISAGQNETNEIINQAWLIAQELQEERGFLIDFSLPNDQELILQKLHRYFLTAERHYRHAIRLDHWVNEEGDDQVVHPLLIKLSEERSVDPLILLESIEESLPEPDELKFDYSQASAYIGLLNQCDRNLEAMASYLAVSVEGCRIRCAKAESVARRQWPIPISPIFHFIPNPWGIRPGFPVQFFLAFETQLDLSFVGN